MQVQSADILRRQSCLFFRAFLEIRMTNRLAYFDFSSGCHGGNVSKASYEMLYFFSFTKFLSQVFLVIELFPLFYERIVLM